MDNNKPKQYTTKQLVESIGVSRQAISNFVKRNNLSPIGKSGSKNVFSEDTYNQLKQYYSSKAKATKKRSSKRKVPSKVTNSGGRNYKYGVPSTMMNVPNDIAPILKKYLDEANPEQRQKFFDSNVKKEIKRILTDKINKL